MSSRQIVLPRQLLEDALELLLRMEVDAQQKLMKDACWPDSVPETVTENMTHLRSVSGAIAFVLKNS